MMTNLSELTLRDIRCFAGTHSVRLAKSTLLVGANSTGKTTFLACCHALADIVDYRRTQYNPFNNSIANLGSFREIATDGKRSFELSGRIGALNLSLKFERDENGMPIEQSGSVSHERTGEMRFKKVRRGRYWTLTGPQFEHTLAMDRVSYPHFSQWLSRTIRDGHLPYGSDYRPGSPNFDPQVLRLRNYLHALRDALRMLNTDWRSPSPEVQLPTRHSIPAFLAPLEPGSHSKSPLRTYLRHLGKKLSLFTDIRVIRDAYADRLEVKVHGRWRNICDVGLGVYSILAILTSLQFDSDTTVLMQQPETHLHPSAQAALIQALAESRGRYLIETHSDFVSGRLQTCVRKGIIKPADVAILWFENTSSGTKVHEIGVDKNGNLIDAPKRYREFFIQETIDYLGLA